MKEIEFEFQTNANGMGVMTFRRIKRGVNPAGKPVYLYSRELAGSKPSCFEVFIPSVKRAGTYPLPNGTSITYTEDFEEYPGASKFGRNAFFCSCIESAEIRFDSLMAVKEVAESNEEETVAEVVAVPADAPKHRGRQKAERPALTIPIAEFSTKELAEQNHVDYPIAAVFIRDAIGENRIKFIKEERRNIKGKPTRIYIRV